MDMSVLANKMLEWEQAQKHADALKAEIEGAVLAIGKTQTVGNVRATYSAGRKSYDYQAAANSSEFVSAVTVALFTTTEIVSKTDWRGICKHAGIDDVPFTQSEPSVTVKLLS